MDKLYENGHFKKNEPFEKNLLNVVLHEVKN